MFLSESTARAFVKITSAGAAALAFSLAGAGSALADPVGGDTSGAGGFGVGVNGPQAGPQAPSPPPPATAGWSGGTNVGADTPVGSADGGVSTGGGVGLPALPPPLAPPASAGWSGGTNVGADTPVGSANGGLSTGGGIGLPTLPPPPPPPQGSVSGSAGAGLGFGR